MLPLGTPECEGPPGTPGTKLAQLDITRLIP